MATSGSWLERLKASKKTLLVQDGKKKVHYTFDDTLELVEEYDEKTLLLLTRKWRKKTALGGDGLWDVEVGEPTNFPCALDDISESNANPRFSRCDTAKSFQWRIRNMPYPLSNYFVSVEGDNSDILVLRTANKKYFKKFDIPDMKRLNLQLMDKSISLSHANNTLIISYAKPTEIMDHERLVRQHLSTLKPIDEASSGCRTS
ncbi:hypothetical protein D915_007639 [Fasciola hepatica]|uniref:Protein DPCD n=1 Tax=Fasciola hepatica TaxID=6192 RepID=A0A4E0R217_FASHE|nr:hypothetical protein D915_007639 [Fasciola hepatica]